MSRRDLEKTGRKHPDTAPEIQYEEYEGRDGKKHRVPLGIDPGWDYNVGQASMGKWLFDKEKAYWDGQKRKAWELLSPGSYVTYNRPEKIPLDTVKAQVNHKAVTTQAGIKEQIVNAIGGEEKVFKFTQGDFSWDVVINADFLTGHVDVNRAKYMPLLLEALENPFEIWSSFERHKGTGQVVLRQRIVKGMVIGKKKGMLVVTNAADGIMKGWTVFAEPNLNQLNKHRIGQLFWKRD